MRCKNKRAQQRLRAQFASTHKVCACEKRAQSGAHSSNARCKTKLRLKPIAHCCVRMRAARARNCRKDYTFAAETLSHSLGRLAPLVKLTGGARRAPTRHFAGARRGKNKLAGFPNRSTNLRPTRPASLHLIYFIARRCSLLLRRPSQALQNSFTATLKEATLSN